MSTGIQPINNTQNNKYKDPLNKNGFVLMSYSNEVGTAIAEIAPKLGTALWAPTFMYLGADIYDKYKNDKNNYDPSAKRALQRAIFQGLTSLIALPAVIYAGQCAVPPLGRFDKSGISGNTKDSVYKHIKEVITQANDSVFENYKDYEELLLNSIRNKYNSRNREYKNLNIFKKFIKKYFSKRFDILEHDKMKMLEFAKINAKETFDLITALRNNDISKIPKRVLNKYKELIPQVKEMYKSGDYSYQATRGALIEHLKGKIFKNKLLKTAGGICALVIFAKPVNNFVEKNIMKKYINPSIDQFSIEVTNRNLIKSNKIYALIKEQNKYSKIQNQDLGETLNTENK